MDRRVGVIGLGIMGGAIARNSRERGWRVVRSA
jgi:L-threonate 2-dehydrogenase